MGRPTKITVDLNALQHNLLEIKKLAPTSKILAMVKSNAYGHGLERIGLALKDADALGVASIEEGTALREAGVKNPIVLMEGLFSSDELGQALELDFTLVLHHEAQVSMLESLKTYERPIDCWLKLDSGMHRLGFNINDFEKVYARLQNLDFINKPIGIMTHFAKADEVHSGYTEKQMNDFYGLADKYNVPLTLCNSAGILSWPKAHASWVRPGLMLYGACPIKSESASSHNLKPVMTFSTKIVAIQNLKKGDKIGYGGTFECPEDMPIGVIAVGYGDGYPQFTKNGTPMLVNNIKCALAGRVSMDMATVDLRNCPYAKVGDKVSLWGDELPIEEIAENNLTSSHELLTRITPRVKVEVK